MTSAAAKEVFVASDDKLRVRAALADQLQAGGSASSGPRAKVGIVFRLLMASADLLRSCWLLVLPGQPL